MKLTKSNIMYFSVSPRSPKCNFLFAPANQNGLKGKIRDLKQMFEEIWEQKKHTKGGGGRRPPLYVFAATPNCLDWCNCPFNPFWLAGGNHKIAF